MSVLAPAATRLPATLFDNSPTYQMACRQLDTVAAAINLDPGIAQRLMVPKRSQVVAVPIRMDDGETRTFIGYRVQHSLTSGPSQGRPALPPQRRPRRGRGPGHVDVVEVRHHEPAVRRGQGRHRLRPGPPRPWARRSG